jgi:peptidoglycan/xylan/chitin deacetylase (PgdA/CDA1 family)
MIKRRVLQVLTSPPAAGVFDVITRPAGVIFFLHRFTSAEGVAGHDPQALRKQLADLRRRRAPLLTVDEIVRRLRDGEPVPRNAAAFTVDDAYTDFATVGAPVFAEFDCPVTVFVTTGCADGTVWFWWDKLRWALTTTTRRTVTIDVAGAPLALAWTDTADAARVAHALAVRLEHVEDAAKHAAIANLAERLELDLPASAPAQFATMTWDEIRAFNGRGVTFGPHTVTHPVLSRTTDAQCEREITDSWRRLEASGADLSHVFCYPNGSRWALTEREPAIVKRLGLLGGVTTVPGYVTSPPPHADARFVVDRVGYSDDEVTFRQQTRGLERAKIRVRASLARLRGARG